MGLLDDIYGRPNGRPVGATGQNTQTGSGIQGTMQQSPYAGFLSGLAQPIQYQDQSQQRYNLAREQIQGGTRMQAEQMRRYMGGRGFRGGESGIADTALGGVFRGGAERLGQASRGIEADEAGRAQQYDLLNLQRQLGGGGLALQGEEGAMDRMMQMWQSMIGSQQGAWQPYWSGVASPGAI